jgi:ABC-type sugar transport system ATPase subunit
MAKVSHQNISKSFGNTPVLQDVSLEIEHGELVVLVGPSGCGKSTLLRVLCGLESIDSGTLRIGDDVVNAMPPAERGIAMVFQSYALYPHMTVRRNMAFGLRIHGADKAEIDRRVLDAAKVLHIDHLLERLPRELSGGQRQRVAIGRAIVREPRLFLFDEPLSNLDAALRAKTRIELARLHRDLAATMVYVTHDQIEAMTLGDKIVVLHEGRVQQAGTPLTLYQQPANRLIRPAIATVAVFTMVPIWNDLWFPLILAPSEKTQTITLGIQQFVGQYATDWNAVLAALALAIIPVVVLYALFSRQLIRGITAGAVK